MCKQNDLSFTFKIFFCFKTRNINVCVKHTQRDKLDEWWIKYNESKEVGGETLGRKTSHCQYVLS